MTVYHVPYRYMESLLLRFKTMEDGRPEDDLRSLTSSGPLRQTPPVGGRVPRPTSDVDEHWTSPSHWWGCAVRSPVRGRGLGGYRR